MKKLILLLTALLVLFSSAALADGRVYRAGETEPFPEGTETFDLYVCPLLGADSMVLLCGDEVMMVDMGKRKDYPAIKEVLDGLGITKIDIAFNTHPHDDHLGSMRQIAADYEVVQFYTAFPENFTGESVIQVPTLKELKKLNIPVDRIRDGDTLTLGGATMEVIQQEYYKKPNPRAAMLKITFGECTILLTGDVIGGAQKLLADTKDLKADIVKFPHHGLTPMGREFLEDIAPEYAVFTHGYKNTLNSQKQLDKAGVDYDFATWGTIHLSTDGEKWIVEQELTEEGIRYTEKYRK